MKFNNLKHLRKNEKGITLVALIITIVILLILAVVAISGIQNDGIMQKAEYAAFKSKVTKYEEELTLYINEKEMDTLFGFDATALKADKTTIPAITDIIKSMNEEDASNFSIQAGKLVYLGSDSQEQEWSGDFGLQVGYTLKRIYGNSIQDTTNGDPSPSNPVEIQSVGDKTVNLLNKSNFNSYGTVRKYIDIYLEAGTYYYSSNLHSESEVTFWTGIIKNDTYDVESPIKTFSAFAGTQDGGSFTISEANTYRFLIYCSDQNRLNSLENVWDNIWIQIEEGSTATEYEPYGKYKIPIRITSENGELQTFNIYLDEPLRKVGDAKDYIDFSTGKVVRNIGKLVLTGSEEKWATWGVSNAREGITGFYLYYNTIEALAGHETIREAMCNILPYHSGVYGGAAVGCRGFASYLVLSIENSNLSDVSSNANAVTSFKTLLSKNNAEFLYALAEQDDTESIDLPDLPILTAETTLSIDTQVQPSSIEK